MFYYISFLRPPPLECALNSTTISITPQIANDLRTELFPGTVDLFIVWLPTQAGKPTSAPRKLTTWHGGGSGTYKPIEVSVPAGVRVDEGWRLGLFAREPATAGSATTAALTIRLDDDKALAFPLPLVSAPVKFVRRVSQTGVGGGAGKSETIERAFLVPASGSGRRVVIREQTSFDLDKKMWDSGLGLSAWLARQLLTPSSGSGQRYIREQLLREGVRVVELGTGTGFVSLILGAALASMESAKTCSILATDLPSAIPLIKHNIATLNIPTSSPISLKGEVLDWDNSNLPEEAREVDVLIMADVTYNTDAFPALLATLRRISFGVLLLGYKQRDPAERELWATLGVGLNSHKAEEEGWGAPLGLELEQVEDICGAGGQAVEVWIGRRS